MADKGERRQQLRAAGICCGCTLLIPVAAFAPMGNIALSAIMALAFVVANIYLLCSCLQLPKDPTATAPESAEPAIETGGVETVPGVETGDAKPAAPPKPVEVRLLYLDQLKVILTVQVIVHHSLGAFLGKGGFGYSIGDYLHPFQIVGVGVMMLDQSYFMALFYFISGYFTPTSYDRKGPRDFLTDKLKRLALPFVFYILGFGPALNAFTNAVLLGNTPSYLPDPGVTWFLAWLVNFNVIYAIYMHALPYNTSHKKRPLPSVAALFGIGSVAGFVQALLMASGISNFLTMPISFGSLPFYAMFFYGGIAAKRNGWLEEALPALSSAQRGVAYGTTLLLGIGVFVFLGVLYASGGRWGFLPGVGGEDPSLGRPAKPNNTTMDWNGRSFADQPFVMVAVQLAVVAILLGVFCMAASITFLDLARKHLNYKTKFSIRMADNAYAAYLVQAYVIIPLTWAYVQMVRAGGAEVFFRDGTSSSSTLLDEAGGSLFFIGFLFVTVVSVPLCWILGGLLRKLPVLRDVL